MADFPLKPFVLARVPEIIFGAGRISELAAKVAGLALIVADPALRGLGITDRVQAMLPGSKVYDGFTGEPKASDIDAAAAMARDMNAETIVGIGGGSALDTAKLVACCAVTGEPASAYELCKTPLPANRLRIVAVPTTAGTGSEVTRVSVFANADKMKVWAWGEELKPDVAILDPELTVAVPAHVTAGTGLDALVHAIEACTNKQANPGNDVYCHRAISLISANLERAVKNPDDLAARGAMLLGSCYGGVGIDNCGTALAHNISHALADIAPIAHGRATGLAMLATMAWVAEGNLEGFARVAQAMGVADAVAAYAGLVRASGIKTSLAGDGIDLSRPELLAERMAAPAQAPMRKSTIRYPRDEDLLELAKKVYALT